MTLRSNAVALVDRVAPPATERRHRFFEHLHAASLRGLGYGLDSPSTSGELALLDRLAAVEMEVIVDAGANRGAWAGEAWQRWPLAEIHAFEPATETFALLSAAVGKNVLCRNAALGDHEGTADLHQVPGLDGLSSLHRRDLAAHGMDMTKSEVVQVVTLDGYCEANDIERIDFLKMDVEGHEMSVLDGAKGLLLERRIERIQFEFGGANIDSRTYLRDFVRLLEGGFDIFRLLKDGQIPLNYRERDEVFVTTNFFADRKRSIN